MRKINKIIIHCTDSPDSRDVGIEEISRWHKEMRFPISKSGFYCGYHYVVRRSGQIEMARSDDETGAHCKGHNKDSIGICWVGRHKPDSEQMKSLILITASVLMKHGLEPKNVFGHCELNPGKSCPNLGNMDLFRDALEIQMNNSEVINGS